MSRMICCVFAAIFSVSLAGCAAHQHTDATTAASAQMATCTMCKEKYEYVYSPKGLVLGQKAVNHNCPMCKMRWTAGVAAGSTCAECAKADLLCPMCAKAGTK